MMLAAIASVLLLQAFVSSLPIDNCPITLPRDAYTKVFGDKCYRFYLNDVKQFQEAQDYCSTKGGSLALVKSQEINDFLYTSLVQHMNFHAQAWIGLNDIDEEDTFVWEDGSLVDYSNWADNNEGPNKGFSHLVKRLREDCVAMDMSSQGTWRDYQCNDVWLITDEHKEYICEFQAKVPDTTTYPTTQKIVTMTQTMKPTETSTEPPTTPTVTPPDMTTGNPTTEPPTIFTPPEITTDIPTTEPPTVSTPPEITTEIPTTEPPPSFTPEVTLADSTTEIAATENVTINFLPEILTTENITDIPTTNNNTSDFIPQI